ncbi:MAG: restriction endonuclease [Eubacteriales bacterium]
MIENSNIELVWILGAILVVCMLCCIVAVIIKKKNTYRTMAIDNMDGHDFEHYCADILEKRGFLEVEVTKGSGDFGIDVLAEKDGITYAIQCKCYRDAVGVKAVQEAYAGRDYYDRMVGVVLTNQYFTTPAVQAAKKLKIVLWDRGYLDSMLEEI